MDLLVRIKYHDDLLATKLCPPRPRNPRVLRRGLLDRLDAGLQQKLTLVSAPAGFGKTTLVVEWLESLRARDGRFPVAWVSLDSGDNDPVRFWRYVFSAIQVILEPEGSPTLDQISAASQAHYEAQLTALINQLSNQQRKHVLVLEDYQAITNARIHAAVAFLLDHLPPALHIVLISRSDPPLPLARLQVRDEVNELRSIELRFTEAETKDFLEGVLLYSLPPELPARLAKRMEGWAAGLRLAALALQRRQHQGEPEQYLEALSGSHRMILEYLEADVLDAQEEFIQEFLLETSLLPRLTASLCDVVTGRKDSALILEQLERANLFLEPLDAAGQWYRFHGLFAEAMQYSASQRIGEPHLRRLAAKASIWYEENSMRSEAVEAALYAQEFERAAGLIDRVVAPRLTGNEYHTLLRWMQNLPEVVLHAHPNLCMIFAQAILFTADRGEPALDERLQAPLVIAEQYWAGAGDEPKLGELLALRSLIAVRQGDTVRAFTFAGQALARLPERDREWRSISLNILGWEEYLSGQMNSALRSFTAAQSLFHSIGNVYGMLSSLLCLGDVYARRGELRQAGELYRQALEGIERAPIEQKDKLGRQGQALLGLAALAYERSELEVAEEQASQAAAIGQEPGGEEILVGATWILARVLRARGEIKRSQELLHTLTASTKRPDLLRRVQTWQAWLALTAGDLAAGQRWSISRNQFGENIPTLYLEQEALILARIQISRGEADEALQQLEAWLADSQEKGRLRSELEIQTLIALAEAALDRIPQACYSLSRALALAQPEGFLQIFLDEGEPLAALLRQAAAGRCEQPQAGQVRALLFAMSQTSSGTVLPTSLISGSTGETLTQQEQRVLRLLAAGLTNPEIAQELVVSVNTVKTHVKSIYRKLDVNDRKAVRAAVRRMDLYC